MAIALRVSRPLAQRPSSHWTDWGQWIALITMTVDHVVRHLMSPEWQWASSSIGRVAFPLFAGMVAWHGCFNTRNPYRYARRIMVIGIVAQLPYMLLPREGWQWNVCFTLGLGLMWVTFFKEEMSRFLNSGNARHGWRLLGLMGLSLATWWWLGGFFEYGHLGLLFVPALVLAMLPWQSEVGSCFNASEAALFMGLALANAALLNTSIMAKSVTVATTALVLAMLIFSHKVPAVLYPMWRKLWLSWYPGHLAFIVMCLLVAGAYS